MDIYLGDRTADTVKIYFEKVNSNPRIKRMLPQKARSVDEALDDYRKTLLPDASSYGRTIWADGMYIGDVWCYCIDMDNEPNAMLSYCIFDESYWSKGAATKAVELFIKEICDRYGFMTIGAFTFSENTASIRVLEKNGFIEKEEFEEDGKLSKYFQYNMLTTFSV